MCNHRWKLRAKNVTVPIKHDGEVLRLASGGFPSKVKSVTFCSDPCCEEVSKIEKFEDYHASSRR